MFFNDLQGCNLPERYGRETSMLSRFLSLAESWRARKIERADAALVRHVPLLG